MSALPTFGNPDDEPAEDATPGQRGALLSWLPDPPTCPGRDETECDTLMQADVVYDPREARSVHAWTCPACEVSIQRDPAMHDADVPQPSRGSKKLRSLFG